MSDGRGIDSAVRDLCKRALWFAVALVLIPAWTYARASDLDRRMARPSLVVAASARPPVPTS